MEKNIEFFNSADGRILFYGRDAEPRQLKVDDKEIIDYVYKMIEVVYPGAMKALQQEYSSSSRNYYFFHYKIVDRFIRCNFGENDLLRYDIEYGTMNMEQVRCPLRQICKNENVICNPSMSTDKETQVAKLYAHGLSQQEIADVLHKSSCTVNAQLYNLKQRLNLKSSHEIIKLFNNGSNNKIQIRRAEEY